MELLLTLEEFCSEEGVFEGSQEGGRHFAAIFEKVRCIAWHVMSSCLPPCPLAPGPTAMQVSQRKHWFAGPQCLQVLMMLYDLDLVGEDAFEAWASEKAHAEEDERIYLGRAQAFLQWLREASEEDDSEAESGED